jgi:elongation factor Ts
MIITASDIAALRAKTGAGMMDCKKALEETGGNSDQAVEILRKNGAIKAAKRAGKIAAEGLVLSYIHGVGKIGVLVEVNCETDFVAKADAFKALVNDIAMQIAGASPKYVSREEIPTDELEKEKTIYRDQLKAEGKAFGGAQAKPDNVIDKILEGKMGKYYSEVCLLDQPFIKDEDKTITQLLAEKTGEIGEKITIRRFTRYELGEGLEKRKNDLNAEVAEQMGQ